MTRPAQPFPHPPSSRAHRRLPKRALAALMGIALASGACGDGLLVFESPGWGQLSLAGAPLEVVLRLPPMAIPETLEILDGDGDPATVEAVRVEGNRLFAEVSGLPVGRQRLDARMEMGSGSVPGMSVSVGAVTWIELVALANADECETLNAVECLLPFPSSRFLEPATTETGFRVRYPAVGMPSAPAPLAPSSFDGNDGFSPAVQILTHFPGSVDPVLSDASRLLPETRTYGTRSLEADSPTLLFDVDAGMQPVLHFIERDIQAVEEGNEREVLFLRPGVSLTPGHRYIVAMRNLVHPDGSGVEAEAVFAALRDGRPTSIPSVEARRPHVEDVLQRLRSVGVARGELVLAFDFVVQSDEDLTREMRAMRDRAFEFLAETGSSRFEVRPFDGLPGSSVEFDCDAPGTVTWRDLRGTFEVPLFLSSDPLLDPVAFGKLVDDDGDGLPDAQGTLEAHFVVRIPCSVLGAEGGPLPPLLSGHGLFGDGPSIVGVSSGFSQNLQEKGLGAFDRVAGATEFLGLSTFDFAISEPSFVLNLLGSLDDFAALPDRLRQGMTNTLVLGRLLKQGSFNSHPAFQTPEGVGVLAGPDTDLDYLGVSLGGIMGLFFGALSPDVSRLAVDIPASNFSILVQRSAAVSLIGTVLGAVVPEPMSQALLWGLAEELWDRGEPAGYLGHVTRDPLPGSGAPKRVLMTVARYDGIVPNEASEITARTLGLPNLHDAIGAAGSVVSERPGVPDVPGPLGPDEPGFVGAQVWYDLAMYDLENPDHGIYIPPLANAPPEGDGGFLDVVSPCEPHGRSLQSEAVQLQISRFLQDPGELAPGLPGAPGVVANTCDGLCDGFSADGSPNPAELDNDRPVPCDPLTESSDP